MPREDALTSGRARRTRRLVAGGLALVLIVLLAWAARFGYDAVHRTSPQGVGPQPRAEASPTAVASPGAVVTPAPIDPAVLLERQLRLVAMNAPAGVVQTVAGHFALDGQFWRFVGFNDFRITSRSSDAFTCGGAHSDAEVDAELARMHDAAGATVVRTWFFQSYVAGASFDWSAFDRVLMSAQRHHLRVVPVLSNQWGVCEEYDHTPGVYKDLSWYSGAYRRQHSNGLPLTYREYAMTIAKHYANDPRIAFWQLMNEAEAADSFGGPCQEAAAAKALRAFADDMTDALRTVDPAHLVSLGTIGGGQCGIHAADYQYVHAGNVDICEFHEYNAQPSPAPRLNPCAYLGKPLFAGERGFNADLGTGAVTIDTLKTRASYVETDLDRLLAVDTAQGYLLWEKSNGPSFSFGVGPGDPLEAVLLGASTTLATSAAVDRSVHATLRRTEPPPTQQVAGGPTSG